jgi:hypothetical protein
MERAFYLGEIDAALPEQPRQRVEAVLRNLAPRLDPFLLRGRGAVERFRRRLAQQLPQLASIADPLARLAGPAVRSRVPLVLVPSPGGGNGGGGFNGGVMVVEVPESGSAMVTFVHEAFHVLLEPRLSALQRAATACRVPMGATPVDLETLAEAMAYALAPGMYHAGPERDPLRTAAERLTIPGWQSQPYARFQRLGLAVRPLLAAALRGQLGWAPLVAGACREWQGLVSPAPQPSQYRR